MSHQRQPGIPHSGRVTVFLLLTSLFFLNPAHLPQADAGTFPATNSTEVRQIRAKIRASQFLSKATFGPDQRSIDALAARIQRIGYKRAVSEWIDQQFALPPTLHNDVVANIIAADGRELDEQGVGVHLYRYQAWWHIALRSPDQLRQRVAWALAQIFVISDSGAGFNNVDKRSKGNNEFTIPDWVGMGDYYDMLVKNADGKYRKMLGDVTWHPCMGVYLSSVRNRKANVSAGRFPDENYAREIMQLKSVGLYQLHQDGRLKVDANGNLIPTYDNEGIKELARVFTGFKYFHNTSTSFYAGRNHGDPMAMDHREHDNNRNYSEDPNAPPSKTIFGVTLSPLASPMTDEACVDEVEEALDVIANHDNVAPFISRLLIQRLVKSNPSRGYIRRVSRIFNNNGQGVRGDLKAVVKAILTDPELFRGTRLVRRRSPTRVDVLVRGTEYSRLREPVIRVTSLIRACRPKTSNANGYFMLSSSPQADLEQMPYRAPSVFNYYLPDYQPPGLIGYVPSRRNPYGAIFAPEFQILTAVSANRIVNRLKSWCRLRYVQYGMRVGVCRITFDLNEELELAKDLNNMDKILRRFDLLLCGGTLSEATKASLKEAITAYTAGIDSRYQGRLEEALLGVILSPDCAIEQ